MASLVPQFTPAEEKGTGRVRADSLRSGRLTGRYQLTGSLLVLKDTSNSVSGFLSFSTSISAAPTSSSTGTGVYIDYTGIYGLASGTAQFYLQASDGKAYAGGGAVVIDSDGLNINTGVLDRNRIKWYDGTDKVAELNADNQTGTYVLAITVDPDAVSASGISKLFLVADNTTPSYLVLTNEFTSGDRFAVFSGHSAGVKIAAAAEATTPSSLLHLKSTAPTFRMQDTTASAKSLLVTVDANVAKFEEAGGNDLLYLDLANLSVVVGNAALATTATDGFLYIPACAGVPTGAPTAYTGRAPMVIDSTNNKMYIYSGGAWVALN